MPCITHSTTPTIADDVKGQTMYTALRQLNVEEVSAVAGGLDIPPSDRDNPNLFTDQLDRSNRIVRQWMLEDPAFAAQMNLAESAALGRAAIDSGTAWVTYDENGQPNGWGFINGSDGERLVLASYEVLGIHVY
jgi:hypothetical protein